MTKLEQFKEESAVKASAIAELMHIAKTKQDVPPDLFDEIMLYILELEHYAGVTAGSIQEVSKALNDYFATEN